MKGWDVTGYQGGCSVHTYLKQALLVTSYQGVYNFCKKTGGRRGVRMIVKSGTLLGVIPNI